MDFADSARRFAQQGARHRQQVYGGQAIDGTADVQDNNCQVATGSFRAAFVKMTNRRDLEQQGFVVDCHAAVWIRDALGITLGLGDSIVYLPDAEQYHVCAIGQRRPNDVEQRYGLRRLET